MADEITIELGTVDEIEIEINPGSNCAPVNIYDQDNNLIASRPSGSAYHVIVFNGIQDDGSGDYENSIVDNT